MAFGPDGKGRRTHVYIRRRLLRRLGEVALVDLGIDADIVERARDDRHGDSAGPFAVRVLPALEVDSPVAVAAKTEDFGERHPDAHFSVLTLFTEPNVADLRRHLLDQDLILVEGGSVANLIFLWRLHGLDKVLSECWQSGVVLAGASAAGARRST